PRGNAGAAGSISLTTHACFNSAAGDHPAETPARSRTISPSGTGFNSAAGDHPAETTRPLPVPSCTPPASIRPRGITPRKPGIGLPHLCPQDGFNSAAGDHPAETAGALKSTVAEPLLQFGRG